MVPLILVTNYVKVNEFQQSGARSDTSCLRASAMACPSKDVKLPEEAPSILLQEQHVRFILKYDEDEEEYVMSEFLRMNAVYWAVTAMDVMGQLEKVDREKVISSSIPCRNADPVLLLVLLQVLDFVQSCYCYDEQRQAGGYSPAPRHNSHILSTLSAVQIATTLDALDIIDVTSVGKYVRNLQNSDGSFFGELREDSDEYTEVDVRFSFAGIAIAKLLGIRGKPWVNDHHGSDPDVAIDVEEAVRFISSCKNFDGGFGSKPGSESHAGLIYCCLGSLSLAGRLDLVDPNLLGWWLCERQLSQSGGLNGRPEKLPDVCYSWWVLASLKILGRLHWINANKLRHFILASQDDETGGISDRPGDLPDPFHTLFGVAGLSLLGGEAKLKQVNPVLCMSQEVIDRMSIDTQMLRM